MPIDKNQTDVLAPCISGCPQDNDIRAVLTTINHAEEHGLSREDSFEKAWRIFTRTNPLPAICGRVCPHPCETDCNRGEKDGSLAINDLERFLGDWAISHELQHEKLTDEVLPQKIGVIGSGPAGLACAYHLARRGYQVTMFEAMPETGGMLRYGIPAYRLPRDVIDAEVQKIIDLGVEIRTNTTVGKDIEYGSEDCEYDAVFLAPGAHHGVKLYCPGEDADNVFSGVKYLHSINSGEKVELGTEVVVIGGGNTAIDAARVARRSGANVTVLYRRTRKEMPASDEEVEEAVDEGIDIQYLTAPQEIITEDGKAVAVKVQRMELGESDDSGRRRPVPISGDVFRLSTNSVIAAVSQVTDWNYSNEIQDKRGWIKTDDWGVTSQGKIFAGGDITGLGLVTEALARGTKGAEAIHARFMKASLPAEDTRPVMTAENIILGKIEPAPRNEGSKLPPKERLKEIWAEVKSSLPEEQFVDESSRCMSCGSSFEKKKITPLLLLRRFTQFGIGTLLFNSYFAVANTKQIYDGAFRNICVPGLNCHACPTATMGCPIGMIQYFAANHNFPWFLIGFLGIIGLISGRFTCGWLCPFGFVQDMMNWFKRFRIPIPKPINYIKYVVLIVLVIIIPYFTYEHWFSKLCPCGALIAAIPWAIWNPVDPTFGSPYIAALDIGTMYWTKIWILAICLMAFVFIKRPFCRTICPLGATYAVFNKISFVSLRVKDSCIDCGRCRELCPMDLSFKTEINTENCIKCMDCTQCEHVEFAWNLPWQGKGLEHSSPAIEATDIAGMANQCIGK
ncbi:MAG: FAD-dependent oxidoreductase [Calditrichaeota bacterium]|nr:FAD-dependent oxidoreductase [Calditrichota bacterium]